MIKLTFVNGHHIVDSVKYGSHSTWGAIEGDINEQRDLSLLLDNVKQDNADTREQLSTKADKEHTHLLKDITDYEAPDLSTYATKEEIPSLNGYATEQWVTSKNYLTQHQSLEDYYTKTQVDTKLNDVSGGTNVALNNYYTKTESDDKYALKTSIPSLNGYATEEWVNSKGFLTTHQSLAHYAKKTDIPNMDGYATKTELSTKQDKGDYALKSDIKPIPSVLSAFQNDVGYLTTHQDLTPYAKKTDIPSLEGYATKQWVTDKNYLTQHQPLTDYYTKSEVDNKFKNFSGGTSTDLTKYYTKVESDGKYATKEEIPSLDGYATEEWVNSKGYLTTHQSLTDYAKKTELANYYTKVESDGKYALKTSIPTLDGYATEDWVNSKGFLTTHQSLTDYAKKAELANYYTKAESDGKYALSVDIPSLNGYATEQWVENKGYLTTHQSLEDYAKKTDLSTKADKEHTHLLKDITDYVAPNLSIYAKKTDIPSLNGYATEQWVTDKGYLTSHQDLTDYAKKTDIPNMDGYATKTELSTKQDKGDYALKSDIKPIPSVLSAFQNDVGYLTTHQDLTSYAKKTDIPSLEGYATEQWVTSKGYLTSHQDISGKQDVLVSGTNIKTVNGATLLGSGNIQIEIGEQALASYAKTADVDAKLDKKANVQHTHEISDVTNLQTKLNGYALKTEIQEVPKFKTVNGQAITGSTDNIEITTDLSNYYKKTETSGATEIRDALANKQDYNANYVTSDQLAGYATTSYVNSELGLKANTTDIPTNTIELTFTLTDGTQITKTFYIQL